MIREAPAKTAIVPEADRLDTLMVIIEERLSTIVVKGELVPRYYNPGNLFRRVELVIAAADHVDPDAVRPLVGDAALAIHSVPAGAALFLRSLGWRPFLMQHWAAPIVALAARARPQLVRCHGNLWNGFAAAEVKRRLGIPYVVSLHCNPDVDSFRGRHGGDWKKRLIGAALQDVEALTLRHADLVLPVYDPIVPYLRRHGVTRYEIVHNAVGPGLEPRLDYALDRTRVEAICVGRQMAHQKDPRVILEAVAALPAVRLTLVGDGDLHATLGAEAERLGIADRVTFIKALPNAEVLQLLRRADVMLYCSDYHEISKTCLEAALAGVPAIVGDRNGDPAKELTGGAFLLVPPTAAGFRDGLARVIADDAFRERLGRAAAARAAAQWRPEAMEARIATLYRRVLGIAA